MAKALPAGWVFDEREGALLELAARQADDVALLGKEIKAAGVMSVGSKGQPVVSPALAEVRQGRLAVGRLLGQLHLPDEDEQPRSETSKRAQKAARVRWNKVAQLDVAARRRRSRGA